jgi:hypothetical protein
MIGWPPTRKGSTQSLSRSGKRRIVRDVRIIDLRTVPLLDHHRAARPGRGRGEYHKVRSNLMRHGERRLTQAEAKRLLAKSLKSRVDGKKADRPP